MTLVFNTAGAVVFAAVGACCVALILHLRHRRREIAHQRELASVRDQSRLSAHEEAARLRTELEKSFDSRRAEVAEQERRVTERDTLLNSQFARVLETEKELREQREILDRKSSGLESTQQELIDLSRQRRAQLEKLAGISTADARAQFLKEIEHEALASAANLTRQITEDAKTHAEEKARKVIAVAIQRYAGNQTLQNSTATIALEGADIKGRIIGREGRNIRAFENATGVTVLIDDEPGAVILSAFDPVRREIAREAMQRLIADGRIHPTRIDEVVAAVAAEMDETIVRKGEQAVSDCSLPPFHPELVKLLGKLHFRQSYAQNLLAHSVEVSHIMGLLASELGVDVTLAKRAGLLHDIGKAVSHEVEGPHAVVGADIVKRCGEPEAVVNGVASHHNDVPPVGPWGILVSAADAISASRPGARAESMTTYLKRVEDLEKIGCSFPGVEKCFAVQAGRELRVFVSPQAVSDETAFGLARSIASKIEAELQYPGQIRVTVIREMRCVEVAK
ncbi:MAG: ribonuclease Y [Verrucomicrobia bacterium]|nr:ribonuclease Y [Verrucomicrobiota bacterium]